MLVINIKKTNDIIDNVKFNGHALYDVKGKDIVCAAASSIYITTVNAILSFDKKSISVNNNEIVNIRKDDITNKLLNNMESMLKELEESYEKNIKIVEE